MSNNFLDYTELTYDEIKARIASRLSEDSRFSEFRESQLHNILLEIFSSITDMSNFYIERRAQESFMGTAQLRSSIIEMSKMLGYVIRRPTPATTSIKLTLSTLPQNAQAGHIISFPKFSSFSFNGLPYILKDGVEYVLTQQDINNFANPNYFKEFEFYSSVDNKLYETELIPEANRVPIELIQAELKTVTIDSNNTQPDQRYQVYRIVDKDFSNFYGDEDFGFDTTTGDTNVVLNTTRVAIGLTEVDAFCGSMDEFDSKKEFIIDRRSFLNNDTIPLLTATDSGKSVKYCVLRTNMDDTVELKFADDIISSIGATGSNNIFIRYLSTKGSAGNFVGVIGRKAECQLNSFGAYGFTNQHVKFSLRRNSVGGSDIEDIESIKINSPEIFYSLDRCVTSRDYINFLKTLAVKGKQVKNAKVWGEQEETRDNTYKIPNIKLFNVVLFSILADMYKKNSSGLYDNVEKPEDILLSTSNSNDWFTLMVMSDSTTPIKVANVDEDLKIVYDKIYTRSEITTKCVYVTPVIRDFKISGYIYLNPLVDKGSVEKKITNAIYSYLSKKADFNVPVYISNIIEIIESFSEVHHADVYFANDFSLDNTTLSIPNSAAEIADISATFKDKPIGYVFNSSITNKDLCNVREYSVSGVDDSYTFYQKILGPMLSPTYSQNTISAISILMPRLEMKMYKYNEHLVRTEPIWPSNNSVDNVTCGIPVGTSGSINYDFSPSERNMYLGMMQCVYNKLMSIVYRDPTLSKTSTDYLSGVMKTFDDFLANRENCRCSLRKISLINTQLDALTGFKEILDAADPIEINAFVNNNLQEVLELFSNTMAPAINQGLLDSYGNIVNYSLRNEIAKIKAPTQSQYLYK